MVWCNGGEGFSATGLLGLGNNYYGLSKMKRTLLLLIILLIGITGCMRIELSPVEIQADTIIVKHIIELDGILYDPMPDTLDWRYNTILGM